MTFEQVVRHFQAKGREQSRNAHCPAHPDSKPSLRITRGRDGRTLISCMAGCDPADVLAAAGLKWDALFAEPGPSHSTEAIYFYSPTLRKRRLPNKRFIAERFEEGEWRPGWNMAEPPLYGINKASTASGPVLVVEGEKDVDRLTRLGYAAVSAINGAGERKLDQRYAQDLARLHGRDFILVPDNDDPGQKLADEWQRALTGIAGSIRRVTWPAGFRNGGDASDFLGEQSQSAFEQLLSSASECLVSSFSLMGKTRNEKTERWPTPLAQLLVEPDIDLPFLVGDLLVAGGTSLLSARPKAGKSTLARYLAVCVAAGTDFLDLKTRKGPVLLIQVEEHRQFLKRQLRCLELDGEEEIDIWCEPFPDDAIAFLERVLTRKKYALVVIDPLLKVIRAADVNAYADMSRRLEPLNDLARRSGSHLMLVHHLSKHGEQSEEGGSLGSTAIDGLVDSVLTLTRKGDMRILRSRQRYGRDLPDTILTFDPERQSFTTAGTPAELKGEQLKEQIVEVLRAEGPASEEAIRRRIGGNTGVTGMALRSLIEEGRISKSGSGRRNSPFLYAIAKPAASEAAFVQEVPISWGAS